MTRLNRYIRAGVAAGALVVALSAASVAAAQDAGSTAPIPQPAAAPPTNVQDAAAPSTAGLEDIIVTAERRESSVQRTPIAITALGGDTLQKTQSVNIESFADRIPNVTFGKNTASAKIFIRGVGLDAITPGSDPRVAIYTDGVYQPRSQAAFTSLYDLERIEVLAGPQGTLYGRNATAGAINFISRDPGAALNGYASLTAGNYGLFREEGAVGGPITDTLGVRIAMQKSNRNGYGHVIDTGRDVDDEDSFGVRGKIVFKPSASFDATLTGDYYKADDASNGLHLTDLAPGQVPTPTKFNFPGEPRYTYASNPRDLAGTQPESHIRSYGVSLTANLQLGDFAKLTSVTGYRKFKQDAVYDADSTTFKGVPAPTREDSETVSQELRLSGSAGILKFMVGGYYFHESLFAGIDPTIRGRLVDVILGGNGSGAAYTGALTFLLGGPPPPFQPLAYYRGPGYGGTQDTEAFAIFTQETVDITDKLGVDLGLRYSNERRSISEFNEFDPLDTTTPIQAGLYAPIPAFTTFLTQSVRYTSVDPKVTVHYQATPNTLVYASFSQGFKSGGYNAGFLNPPFSPEKLRAYEAGIKTDLADHHIRANIAGFYYDYSNLQVNITNGIQLVTRNAAKAELYGLEGQFTFLPVDDFRISLNASYLHSQYKNYLSPNPRLPGQGTPGVTVPGTGGPTPAFNLAGNQLAYAPKYKVDGEVAYTFHGGAWDVTPRVNAIYTSRTFFNQFNEVFVSQKAYGKLDLYLDVLNKDFDLSVTLFMRNATNKYYKTSGTVSSDFLGFQVVGALGAPRTFGASLTKRF